MELKTFSGTCRPDQANYEQSHLFGSRNTIEWISSTANDSEGMSRCASACVCECECVCERVSARACARACAGAGGQSLETRSGTTCAELGVSEKTQGLIGSHGGWN